MAKNKALAEKLKEFGGINMTREIKVRAWDKENDRMLFPDDTDDILFEITIDGIKTIDMNGNEDPYAGLPYLDTVIMQYTDIKSTQGVEIYDGDVIYACDFNSLRTGGHAPDNHVTGKVVFENGMYMVENAEEDCWLLADIIYNDDEAEIIGNIYENPELIQGEAE